MIFAAVELVAVARERHLGMDRRVKPGGEEKRAAQRG